MKRISTRAIAAVAFGTLFGASLALAQAEPTAPPNPPFKEVPCPSGATGTNESLQEVPCPPGVGGTGAAGMTTTTVTTEQGAGINQINPLGVMALGGVEGYSGALASQLKPGFGWGVAAFYEPWKVLGFELGYNGGLAYFHNPSGGTPTVAHNGGYGIVTPGVTLPFDPQEQFSLKPYLLGGIGFDGWSTQNATPAGAWHNTTTGSVPFGGGLELRAARLVANARFNYAWDFGPQFNPFTKEPLRYQGLLSLGGAF